MATTPNPQIQYPWAARGGASRPGYGGKQIAQTSGEDYRKRRAQLGGDPLIGTRPDEPIIGHPPKQPDPGGGTQTLLDLLGGGSQGQPGPGGGSGTGTKFPDQVTPPGSYPAWRNPYGGIPGFEFYGREQMAGNEDIPAFLRRNGLRRPGPYGQGLAITPGVGGYPTRERVQQISGAMGGFPGMQPRRGTAGADVGTYDDILKRMLKERRGEGY